ncbi:MAG: phospho-N-acetylmuramoyl-pentapeptide-transferase [Puniceicoccales bacterium]|jgi:phospho-N-acetylmuramoyl-pentapeptide-transferase|nr:phospho-N-acetylmuramoyl-pentapeptide-transferase [Puniceicoccales bacterium]
MLYYLNSFRDIWGPLRLFEYQTFRAMMAGITALVIGFIIAPRLIRFLNPFRQPELDAGTMGELAKTGGKIPTMGGAIILVPALLSAFLWLHFNVAVAVALFVYLGMSTVGFIDDYVKVFRNNPNGISPKAKMAGLTLVALLGIAVLLLESSTRNQAIEIWVPFVKTAVLSADTLPLWAGAAVAVVFFWLVTVSSSNAVNLTDGMDGLSVGCVITTLFCFGLIAYLSGHAVFASYLHISRVVGAGELTVLTAAILGGCMAFLWHNALPATIYMGDVGALGLGGVIGAIAFITNQPFLLIIIGGVFVAEAASVIIQTSYYKRTKGLGKNGEGLRIFKMAPLHHHFRKEGVLSFLTSPDKRWADSKIIIRFWMISFLCGLIGLATLKLR